MGRTGDYEIEFVKLKNGFHGFEYVLGKSFFDLFEYSPVSDGNVTCQIGFTKETNLFNLHFEIGGKVKVTCDTCLAELDHPVTGTYDLVVKVVEDPQQENGDEDDILYLSSAESRFDISGYLYDMVNLALPIRRTCDNEGKEPQCDTEMIRKLEQVRYKPEGEKDEGTDPRWDALKEIL